MDHLPRASTVITNSLLDGNQGPQRRLQSTLPCQKELTLHHWARYTATELRPALMLSNRTHWRASFLLVRRNIPARAFGIDHLKDFLRHRQTRAMILCTSYSGPFEACCPTPVSPWHYQTCAEDLDILMRFEFRRSISLIPAPSPTSDCWPIMQLVTTLVVHHCRTAPPVTTPCATTVSSLSSLHYPRAESWFLIRGRRIRWYQMQPDRPE